MFNLSAARIARIAAAAAVAASAVPSASSSEGKIGFSIELRATMPVVCRLSFGSASVAPAQGQQINFGMVEELCNASRGYRIFVNYDPSILSGSQVRLGNDAVQLNSSGVGLLTDYDTANIRSRPMSMQLSRQLSQPTAISLRIEASI